MYGDVESVLVLKLFIQCRYIFSNILNILEAEDIREIVL